MEDRGTRPPAEVQNLIVGPHLGAGGELMLPVAGEGRRIAYAPRDTDALDERVAVRPFAQEVRANGRRRRRIGPPDVYRAPMMWTPPPGGTAMCQVGGLVNPKGRRRPWLRLA